MLQSSLIRMVRRLLIAIVLLASSGVIAAGQGGTGFIVIAGISNGPAEVIVDGRRVGELHDAELTIPVTPGIHAVVVRKYGFPPITKSVDVRFVDDVQSVKVEFVSTAPRAARTETSGSVRQDTVQVRITHLDPAEVAVEYAGKSLGRTPLDLWLPVGPTTLRIGPTVVCLDVRPKSRTDSLPAVVRLRAGRVESLHRIAECQPRGRGDSGLINTNSDTPPPGLMVIRVGQTLRGVNRGVPDMYSFQAGAGQSVIITMSSDDFSAYLAFGDFLQGSPPILRLLKDAYGQVTSNAARLDYKIVRGGTYYISAGSLHNLSGRYTLTLETAR